MGGAGAEPSLCVCCEECQEYKKVFELKEIGLVIYWHTTCREDVNIKEPIGAATSTPQGAFILHNTRDVTMTPSDLKPELDKNEISCPRCRQIFEQAQGLLQIVKSIDGKNVIGVCDHCLKKAQSIKKLCLECNKVAKKFIASRDTKKKETMKNIKLGLSKMGEFVNNAIHTDRKIKCRTYSDLQIHRLSQYSLKSRHEHGEKHTVYPEINKSDTNLCTATHDTNVTRGDFEKPVDFTQYLQSVDIRERLDTTTPGTHFVESDATFGDDLRKGVREAIKEKHDLGLRHMLKTEKQTESVPTYTHKTEKLGHQMSKGERNIHSPTISDYILRKQFSYFFPRTIKQEAELLGARSSQLITNTQEMLRQRAEDTKKRHEEERKKQLEEEEKKKIAREEKKRLAEEKKKLMDEQYNMDEQKKYYTGKKDTEKEIQRRLGEDESQYKAKEYNLSKDAEKTESMLEYGTKEFEATKKAMSRKHETKYKDDSTRDLKFKPKKSYQFDVMSENPNKDLNQKKSKSNQSGETGVSEKNIKELKTKLDQKSKIDAVREKTKKELKSKSESKDEMKMLEKIKKGLKTKPDDGDKSYELSGKTKKEFKTKSEQRGRSDEATKKDWKPKPDPKETRDKVRKDKSESKADRGDTIKEVKERDKKDVKSAAKTKDMGEADMSIKAMTEDKNKLHQTAQLQTEKNLAAQEKRGSAKDTVLSKKMEGRPKENLELPKKEKLAKKQQDQESANREVTKQLTTKEIQEFTQKQPDMLKEKVEIIGEKQGLSIELPELAKRKHDISSEKEEVKGNKTPRKEEPSIVQGGSKVAPEVVFDKKRKDGKDDAYFLKLQGDISKQEEENLKRKTQQESELQKLRDIAEKKAQETGDQQRKSAKKLAKPIIKPDLKSEKNSTERSTKKKEPSFKELNIRDIKMHKTFSDDLILRLVRIKQTATKQTIKPRPLVDQVEVIEDHHDESELSSFCELCFNSDLEIDMDSYQNKLNIRKEVSEIIIGENVFKHRTLHQEKTEEQNEVPPILFQSIFEAEPAPPKESVLIISPETEHVQKHILANLLLTKDSKGVETESGKGIIRYALSDRTFIDKGWTMLPTEKVVRKMNVYRMRPAHPEFDWFEHNKNKRLINYDSGEKLAEFDDNGRGRWYYRSGRLALDYYDAEETNAQQRFVIYSSGEPDERGRTHPITILATFDYLGNGIVFDHAGKIRLKYNQTEGVVLDRGIGPVSHWKWHTLNDPPVLQQVMIDTQMAHKDPAIIKLGTPADTKIRPDNEEMLAIEFDNFIKEKSKKLSQKFKPFQIKMKALKINEHFSLKVLDQATIYLIFRDGSTNLKLNIGMILDHQEIVDTDTAEVGEVSNNLERFPARTDSLAGLQRSVAYAQRYERQRTERERRLRPSEPCASADQLTAAASTPLRLPIRTIPLGSTSSAGYCNCRKPVNNLYYNTRLL